MDWCIKLKDGSDKLRKYKKDSGDDGYNEDDAKAALEEFAFDIDAVPAVGDVMGQWPPRGDGEDED